jgi:hypothetical protein
MSDSITNMLFYWKRLWSPRGAATVLTGGGFLLDPEAEYGPQCNPHVVSFEQIEGKACLILLGEPGIGKTTALDLHRASTESAVRGAGDVLLGRNLNTYQSDTLLTRSLFEDPTFIGWKLGTGILHLFLDSFDECLIRIDTLAALLAHELAQCPIDRLRLRIACRTAVWPGLLEDRLMQLWGQVVNNSWGMFNPTWDFPVGDPQNYSDNPNHPFNIIVASLEAAGADILFAAGNCGPGMPRHAVSGRHERRYLRGQFVACHYLRGRSR